MIRVLITFMVVTCVFSFHLKTRAPGTSSSLAMGFFDDVGKMFSKENQEAQRIEKERQKEEMMQAQKEILERRANPRLMRQYEEDRSAYRMELAKERAVYNFQQKSEDGYDPLTDWERLREEGKIKIGKDLERDDSTSRLGSEGLYDVRVDERYT